MLVSNVKKQNRKLLLNLLKALHSSTRKSSTYNEETLKVRFAPSPTGYLHIGGLRTALYNYLFARKHDNGKFVVRIEDTDQSRVVPQAYQQLQKTLHWAGLVPDESPMVGGPNPPYVQSDRKHLYKQYAKKLVDEGKAYYCFCSQRRLQLLKLQQTRNNEVQKYDNKCRNLSPDEVESNLAEGKPYVIRLKLRDGNIQTKCQLSGESSFDLAKYEGDPVLLKSDGYPTYHLANVVDDYLMGITHVIRGKEWLNSLPKHMHLYESFNWNPPKFYHVPLLLNMDGKKLSKRHGDIYVEKYMKRGYSQSSLINFIASCSGGFPNVQFPINTSNHYELLDQLVEEFDINKLSVSDGKINFAKLDEFSFKLTRKVLSSNNPTVVERSCSEVESLVKKEFPKSFVLSKMNEAQRMDHISNLLISCKDRLVKLRDIASDEFSFLWQRPKKYSFKSNQDCEVFLEKVSRQLAELDFNDEDFDKRAKSLIKLHQSKDVPVWKIMRQILAGSDEGMPIVELIKLLGKNESIKRIEHAILKISSQSPKEKTKKTS